MLLKYQSFHNKVLALLLSATASLYECFQNWIVVLLLSAQFGWNILERFGRFKNGLGWSIFSAIYVYVVYFTHLTMHVPILLTTNHVFTSLSSLSFNLYIYIDIFSKIECKNIWMTCFIITALVAVKWREVTIVSKVDYTSTYLLLSQGRQLCLLAISPQRLQSPGNQWHDLLYICMFQFYSL